MSLFTLKKFISQEDFADAHEPLNDGVKEVPNAQTVAASTKTSDVGTDTNTQGSARVIPEKEDTDDKTEKQFDTVSESAEKGAPKSDSKGSTGEQSTEEPGVGPEPKGNPVKPTPPKADTAKPDEGSEDTKKDSTDAGTKAPPFVKKEAAEESEAKLEHETPEANEDEIKKTEKATKALEAFVPHASRFDIVGYPRKDQDQVRNTISFLRRRSGKDATVSKLSLESISEAVELGKARLELLRGQAEIHTARKAALENYDAVVEQAITAETTEHGSEPLPAAAAAELTAIETDPLDIPNVVEIERLQESIQTLQAGQAALEQHLTILRSNKRISKQAAAVLQAGLEHIDQTCGLKVRATGLEGYVATPRAALEDADVNEKSLLDRAGEIGAKILNWLIKLLETVEVLTLKYSEGIVSVTNRFQKIKDSLGIGTLPEITLKSVDKNLFMNDDFIGDKLTAEEKAIPAGLKDNRQKIMGEIIQPLLAILRSGPATVEMSEAIKELSTKFDNNGEKVLPLPGGAELVAHGITITYKDDRYSYGHDQNDHKDVTVPALSLSTLERNITEIIKYLSDLSDTSTALAMLGAGSKIKAEIIALRRRSKGGDEAVFQKVQSETMTVIREALHQRIYFMVLGLLAKAQYARATYFEARLSKNPNKDT